MYKFGCKCKYLLLGALVTLGVVSCVYDYTPQDRDIEGLDRPLVVIDGDIIVGGITNVHIKLTEQLLEEELEVPLGASVWVESEAGEILNGTPVEGNPNKFEVNTSELELSGRYRLVASIPGRGEYVSSFKGVLVSPPIDSITYSIPDDRSYARIEVTTHNNSTDELLFCKWTYSENWESNSYYRAVLGYDIMYSNMVQLTEAEIDRRTYCFSEAESVGTYIANTEKLTENLIYKFVVNDIPNTDSRLTGLYAITVRQTALDKEAYEYWKNVRTNSTELGGLFSPQPSEIIGNVKNVIDLQETVLGYVNVTTQQSRRVFFNWAEKEIFITDCHIAEVPNKTGDASINNVWNLYYRNGYRPVSYPMDEMGAGSIAYWAAEKCVDCRSYSNSTKPDFWPR